MAHLSSINRVLLSMVNTASAKIANAEGSRGKWQHDKRIMLGTTSRRVGSYQNSRSSPHRGVHGYGCNSTASTTGSCPLSSSFVLPLRVPQICAVCETGWTGWTRLEGCSYSFELLASSQDRWYGVCRVGLACSATFDIRVPSSWNMVENVVK